MRSVYSVECLCGRKVESESRELECPSCGQKIRVEWPASESEESIEGPPKRSAAGAA